MDLNDVGVAEPGNGLGLDAEPGEAIGPCLAAAANHLNRDPAVESRLPRQVDHAHAALANLLEQLVAGDRGQSVRGDCTGTCRWLGMEDPAVARRRAGIECPESGHDLVRATGARA